MGEEDYTKIRDDRVRGVICRLMSEMLDNPDEHGIYPTARFMWKMENFVLQERKVNTSLKEALEECQAALYGCRELLGGIANVPHAIELADLALGKVNGG